MELQRVHQSEQAALADAMRPYLAELAKIEEKAADLEYPYLPLYWTESGREAYWLEEQGSRIGFALVNRHTLIQREAWSVSEFHVAPPWRRKGLGRQAAWALLTLHPGWWEIGILRGHSAALSFWTVALESCPGVRLERFQPGAIVNWDGHLLLAEVPPSPASDGWPVIAGPDCVLRVLAVGDAADWYQGEDDEQRRWFDFPQGPPAPLAMAVAGVERCIESWRAAWREGGPQHHWGIWTDDGRRLAGGVEVRVRADRRANVSYIVFPHARRRGLATLAVRLAAEWAFNHLDIDGLVAVVDEKNVASRGVALAAGFVLEGPAEAWEYSESGFMLRYVRKRLIRPDSPRRP
jgi:predicted acetyltransferase/RimJ/RimL family protein N-acetyltransferase